MLVGAATSTAPMDHGFNIEAIFDLEFYRRQAGEHLSLENAIRHYRGQGEAAGYWPHPLFDPAYYAGIAGAAASGMSGLDHYLQECEAGRQPPAPLILFDPDHFIWSCAKLHRPVPPGANPFLHYLTDRRSWAAMTHTLFDPEYYEAALARSGLRGREDMPPLADFLHRPEAVAPHFAFDPAFYLRHAAMRGTKVAGNALLHHAKARGRGGIQPHPLFAPGFYLATNPDVERSRFDPLVHFIRLGRYEGRDPHPLLALKGLDAKLPAATPRPARFDAFEHYIATGGAGLADPHKLFDAALYAALHPECLAPGASPLAHFVELWAARGVLNPVWGTCLFERRPGAAGSERIDLILVSHELTRTGAPLILLALLREFVERLGLGCLVIAQRGGVLLEAFREYAPVIDLERVRAAGMETEGFLRDCLTAFDPSARPRAALVNTACVDATGAALAATGLPVITLVHELADAFEAKVFETIYASSQAVIYPAVFVRNEAHLRFALPIAKALVQPQGLLDPEFGSMARAAARREVLESIGAPEDAFVVLGCGTLDLRKGIDLFAAVGNAAISRAPDMPARPLYFVWVGGGLEHVHSPAWYVHNDIKRAGLEARVRFIGPRLRTEPFFAGCDAFLLCSRQDPFPCVVHEAMAYGLPVIAFENAGGAPEALAGGAGLTVPFGDIPAMAAVLRRLAAQPAECAAIAAAARARVAEVYRFADYADAVLNIMLGGDAAPGKVTRLHKRRERVIFTLPDGARRAGRGHIEALVAGLGRRGFDAELILTAPRPAPAAMHPFQSVRHRLLATQLRQKLDLAAAREQLGIILDRATPAVLVVADDAIAAAQAATLPRRAGLLGLVRRQTPAALERARNWGPGWQRAVVSSEPAAARLLEEVPALRGRCVVIPDGLARLAPPSAGAAGSPQHLVCIARQGGESGMREAAALIKALAGTGSVLHVLGDAADCAALAVMFTAPAGEGRLVLHPDLDLAARFQCFLAAEAFIQLGEGHGGETLAEAMSAGLAVIDASGSLAPDSWHRDGVTGISLAPGDPAAIVAQVRRLAAAPEDLLALRRAAQAAAQAHSMPIEENHDRYAALLHEMLAALRDDAEAGGRAIG